MKQILCYGDSNTYGLIAGTYDRFSEKERWSGILTEILKNEYEVIEDGLNDRNGFLKNPKGFEYCGLEHLHVCLKKYSDIQLVILALGTNDLQFTYDFDEKILQTGLTKLINTIKEYNNSAKIIIVPPVKIDTDVLYGFFSHQFNELSISRSDKMFNMYKEIAKQYNLGYFDFNEIVRPSSIDGLHYKADGHKQIAIKFADYIKIHLN